MHDTFLQLYIKERSYILQNQGAGCHEDGVAVCVIKEIVSALGNQSSESKGRIFEVLSKNVSNILYWWLFKEPGLHSRHPLHAGPIETPGEEWMSVDWDLENRINTECRA